MSSIDSLIEELEGSESSHSDSARIDEIAIQIRKQFGRDGEKRLLKLLTDTGSPKVAESVVIALTQPPVAADPGFQDFLLKKLDSSESEWLAVAIDGLRFLKTKAPETIVDLVTHESSRVRAATCQYLVARRPEIAKPILMRALNDADPRVRETAVDGLEDILATDALNAIRKLINDEDLNVREAAITAVETLTAAATD